MRHAAIEFSSRVDAMWDGGVRFDVVFVTDMLNVAELRGLLQSDAKHLPLIVYFHENQFEYPNQTEQTRDFHFPFTNFTSALAADAVWFNSAFNRDSMSRHLQKKMPLWPDFPPERAAESLIAKSAIEYPGLDCPKVDSEERAAKRAGPLHIAWAARWEHDKGPGLLLLILQKLKERRLDFRLSVVGQSYKKVPGEFETIKNAFSENILHWGYQEDREKYFSILASADVFLSSANHEFFGLSVVEAAICGCYPLLPNRIVYPEILNVAEHPDRKKFLYDTVEEAVDRIIKLAAAKAAGQRHDVTLGGPEGKLSLADEFRQRFGWASRANALDQSLQKLVESVSNSNSKGEH